MKSWHLKLKNIHFHLCNVGVTAPQQGLRNYEDIGFFYSVGSYVFIMVRGDK